MIANSMLIPKLVSKCPEKEFLGEGVEKRYLQNASLGVGGTEKVFQILLGTPSN